MRTVRFFKGVCDTMKQDLHLPADYAVLSDNEMTYTQGGGVISTLLGLYSTGATIVGTGVLAASYAWGIQQTRDWLKQPGNKEGNVFTVYGRALDALSADMKKSSSNFLRDAVSDVTASALAPVSLVLILRKSVPLPPDDAVHNRCTDGICFV